MDTVNGSCAAVLQTEFDLACEHLVDVLVVDELLEAGPPDVLVSSKVVSSKKQ